MTTVARPTTFQRLELWEDGRRTSDEYQPGAFERWHVDARLTDGSTIVLTFGIDQDPNQRAFVYRALAMFIPADADGEPFAGAHATRWDASISRMRPHVQIGKSYLCGDLYKYRVVMDEGELGGLGLDLTITRTCPPRVSPANRDNPPAEDDVLGWVCAVPRGKVTGTMTRRGTTTAVEGDAYHDHNWGTTWMGDTIHRWIWGRAAIGPYTAVFSSVCPTQHSAPEWADGMQSLFVASDREVLVNVEGPGTVRVTAPPAPNPDPRNPHALYSPSVTFEVEQKDRRMVLEAAAARLIGSLDLAQETRFLSPAQMSQAARMEHKPWYTRFVAAPVTLSTVEGGQVQIYQGQGVVEFMDLHLNPAADPAAWGE